MMYEQFYGFVQSPFTLTPDPRFLYLSQSHHEAITLLAHAIRRKEAFIVLTGDIGTGKTTVCRALFEQLDPRTSTSLVLNPFLTFEELVSQVLLDFGVLSHEAVRMGRQASVSKNELIRTLHEFLLSLVPIHGSAVLVIDEAQHLTPQVLEEIRLLSNLETNESKLLQIVLVGQLSLRDLLASPEVRQLDQRISVRAQLTPLTRDEVNAYIAHRLQVAQGSSAVVFEPAAVDLLHQVTEGVPRVINMLCDRALMAGAHLQVSRITPALVQDAAEMLALKVPAAATASHPRRSLRRVLIATALIGLLLASVIFAAPLYRLVNVTPPLLPARPPDPPHAQPIGPYDIPSADFLLPAVPIKPLPVNEPAVFFPASAPTP